MSRDWRRWHDDYDDPGSPLARRLAIVRRAIGDALDRAAPGPIRVLSLCAGQGRDLLEVLRDHRRAADVAARLVELDTENVCISRGLARDAGLAMVEVVQDDAGTTDAVVGAAPADLVLVCGVFGNISDLDVETTVRALPMLCARHGTVIWTRTRRPPDLTTAIRRLLAEVGFDEIAFVAPDGDLFSVGVHRHLGEAITFERGRRLFTFV